VTVTTVTPAGGVSNLQAATAAGLYSTMKLFLLTG